MITPLYFPGVPYRADVRITNYTGVGSFVLKPGSIVAPGGYKSPQSLIGETTDPKLRGIYVLVEGAK